MLCKGDGSVDGTLPLSQDEQIPQLRDLMQGKQLPLYTTEIIMNANKVLPNYVMKRPLAVFHKT